MTIDHVFADRVKGLKGSAIREIFNYLSAKRLAFPLLQASCLHNNVGRTEISLYVTVFWLEVCIGGAVFQVSVFSLQLLFSTPKALTITLESFSILLP